MSSTIIGYNRFHPTGYATVLDGVGTSLVTKEGTILDLPAGCAITEVKIKRGSEALLVGAPSQVIVYMLEDGSQFDILEASKADLNATPGPTDPVDRVTIGVIGSDASPVCKASAVDRFLMVRTDGGNFGMYPKPNGASVCVSFKIKKMPTL